VSAPHGLTRSHGPFSVTFVPARETLEEAKL